MEQMLEFIANNGFAIVMCLCVFWAYIKQGEQHTNELKALNEKHHEETKALLQQMTINSEGIKANAAGIQCVLEEIKQIRRDK